MCKVWFFYKPYTHTDDEGVCHYTLIIRNYINMYIYIRIIDVSILQRSGWSPLEVLAPLRQRKYQHLPTIPNYHHIVLPTPRGPNSIPISISAHSFM